MCAVEREINKRHASRQACFKNCNKKGLKSCATVDDTRDGTRDKVI